jgi:hypothetical protein
MEVEQRKRIAKYKVQQQVYNDYITGLVLQAEEMSMAEELEGYFF